jgi:phthiocerol/phenolphthiocerol synthesis type-I polyketide synthase C
MAFRFPGDLSDEEGFWEVLSGGKDVVGTIDSERWAIDRLHHPKRSEPGRSITFSAGHLSRIDEFDAAFFDISPREAAMLDPQQRLLLEMAWEAMENAGQVPARLAGSDCAVYVGISGLDHGMRGIDDVAALSAYSMTGNTLSIAANRLSYVFDLRGPSMAVDTACSSSLVALHQACATLQKGEASLALVGGINLLVHPYPFIAFTKASMLSATGRCRAFDAAGDGYVRAEGGAVLLLKPLAQAEADGDPIQAIILGSGTNTDGARKTGITIPSAHGQIDLMRSVLERTGLTSDQVDYVEAHGTGTPVGDPIEAHAIGQVYGRGRATPIRIGSVKTNLGHLEPASGMAGLVKTVLMLKHRELAPSLHLVTPNPHIDFTALNLEVVTSATALNIADARLPVMGVNSFGFGGANAHILLQAPAPAKYDADASTTTTPRAMPPLFLSARNEPALRALVGRYAALLRDSAADDHYDIAWSAAFHRQHLDKRLALRAEDGVTMAERLDRIAAGEVPTGAVFEEATTASAKVAFIYSGNGAQWAGMGLRLLQESPRFAELMAELDATMAPRTGFALLDELRAEGDTSRIDDTAVAQPLLFALQVAVTTLLREQGIEAAAMAGHSVGEVAAAWAADILSLDQAIDVICARSAAQALTRGAGRMAVVGLSVDAARELIAEAGCAEIEIAGINSPHNVSVAGPLAELTALQEKLAARGILLHLLDLDYAFHSRAMDPVREGLAQSLAALAPVVGNIDFVSTVTGQRLDGTALDAGYWWDNVRKPVRFADAIGHLAGLGCGIFIEIGPHAILQRYIIESLAGAQSPGRAMPTLRKDSDGVACIDDLAMRIRLAPAEPSLEDCFPTPGRFVSLPNYPWQRERHWHTGTNEKLDQIHRERVHPLLGWRLKEADVAWENTLDPILYPWLADHCVTGVIVLPAAAYVDMALAAARETYGGGRYELEQLNILAPVIFDAENARALRFELNPRQGHFRILSRTRLSADDWTLNAVGRLLGAPTRPAPAISFAAPIPAATPLDPAYHYHLAAEVGLKYGPAFQGLTGGMIGENVLEAEIVLPPVVAADAGKYLLHPALLDACFQSLVTFFRADIEAGIGKPPLPIKIGRLLYHAGPDAVVIATRCRAVLAPRGKHSVRADFELLDADSRVIATLEDCRFREAALLDKSAAQSPRWHTVPRLLQHVADRRPIELPGNDELATQASAWLTEREPALQREEYFHDGQPLFDALVVAYTYTALLELRERHGDWLQDALNHPETLPAARRAHFLWLVRCLRDANLLREAAGTWVLEEANAPPAPEDIWRTLLADFPSAAPELLFVGRVGRRLADLIAEPEYGSGDIFRQSHLMEPYYQDSPVFRATNLALREMLSGIGAAWPDNRRMRVLEISSGGNDSFRYLADCLPADRVDYVIACDDEERLGRLRAEYPRHASVIPAMLSPHDLALSSDRPLPGGYDIILVRHWLHRAHDLPATLIALRRLLSSGGKLILAERHSDLAADFIFGTAPTWWHGSAEGPVSSLMAPSAWATLLGEHGFDDIATITEPVAIAGGGAYLLLARNPDAAVAAAEPPVAAWLLLHDASGRSHALAERVGAHLESRGQRIILAVAQQEPAAARAQLIAAGTALERINHIVRITASQETPGAQGIDSALLSGVLHLTQLLAAGEFGQPRLWLVTSGAALATHPKPNWQIDSAQAPLWGFGRVVMNEAPALACTLIDIACDQDDGIIAERLHNELLRPDGENEIVLAADARYGLRVKRAEDAPPSLHVIGGGPRGKGDGREERAAVEPRFRLDFTMPGQLRNLTWIPQQERELAADEIEVRPQAAGLNFRDVMYAMGLLPDEAVENGFSGATLGLEFAGIVSRVGVGASEFRVGDEVMGFGPACFSSHVVTRAGAVAPKPQAWSFAEAATVPTAFFTAYYALKHLTDLQAGERVLIHGGAGGLGIAAIQVANHLGAEIYATAGSDEKRDFVRLLGADHVLDSRSLAFADEILDLTAGEGVDVVLNSLAGEAINRNLRVLKPFGRFLELGKRDFFENTRIGLRPFKNNISYFGIDADQLLIARPQLATRLFREMMSLFQVGALVPLPQRVFPAVRAVEAFRCMQQSRHIGKVVIDLDDTSAIRIAAPPPPVLPAPHFEREASYLVSGGIAGFGLESACWLARQGAGHLVLLGRRGMETPGAAEAVARIEALGAQAYVFACDVGDREALRNVLAEIERDLPPLRGVLHAAAVFDDGLLLNQDAGRFERVIAPKARGAWHLHELTLDKPLDYFILYSSVTSVIGNPGQSNYVAANAFLESLAIKRRALGLPAICVGWGPIADAGYLTRNAALKAGVASRIGEASSAMQALEMLGQLLATDAVCVTVADLGWSTLARLLPSAGDPRFDELRRTLGDADSSGELNLRAIIDGKSPEEVLQIVVDLVRAEVAQILGTSPERVDTTRSLLNMGMDSLMAVELAMSFEKRFALHLPAMALNEGPSIERIAARLVEQLLGGDSTPAEPSVTDMIGAMAAQHDITASDEEIAIAVADVEQTQKTGAQLIP